MSYAPPATVRTRSRESRAFEAYWRSLLDNGLVPSRKAFKPAEAVPFLRDLTVMEAPGPQRDSMRIRFCGERPHKLAGRNLAGLDFLDLIPAEYHAGTVATGHLMLEAPCGLWQISPLHLARGYAERVEITVFPLSPVDSGPSYLLCLMRSLGELLPQSLPATCGMALDTAVEFRFLDVGAGEPAWPIAA